MLHMGHKTLRFVQIYEEGIRPKSTFKSALFFLDIYMYVYIYMYACMYVCMYIYIYIIFASCCLCLQLRLMVSTVTSLHLRFLKNLRINKICLSTLHKNLCIMIYLVCCNTPLSSRFPNSYIFQYG